MPVYCIIGANRGIGLEFVSQLARSPDNTILALTRSFSSDLDELKSVSSPSAHILECDLGNVDSIWTFPSLANKTLARGQKLYFLLNNAGVNGTSQQTSLSLEPERLMSQIKINVLGPAKMVEFLLGADLSPSVRILNMTSGLGSLEISSGINPRKSAGYSISKAALNMLTVHQSGDIRAKLPGAVVISMDPGWVRTRLGGPGAAQEPRKSIGGMLDVLHKLREEDICSCYHHSGDRLPW